MSNRKILIANVLIVLIVALSVISYAKIQMQKSEKKAVLSFQKITDSMGEIVDNYLTEFQRTCNSWRNFISANPMTMEEAMVFVKKSKTAKEISIHIVWLDSLKGLSSEASATDSTDFHVSYEAILADDIQENAHEDAKAHVTRRYTNPINGNNVISFYSVIHLINEKGEMQKALLLRVIPISYLEDQWIFPTDSEQSQVALMQQHGSYVLQPAIMKNSDFYSFVSSYNKGEIDTKKLEDFIVSNDSGSFYARNSRNEEMLFSFRHSRSNNDWVVMACMPNSELAGRPTDWTVPFMILIALGIVLMIDVTFLSKLRQKDKKIQDTLSQQLETIQNQERLLQDALSAAVAANSAKSIFLSNMSHDIRTPMNAIVGLSTLLARDAENPEKVREHTKKIASSSQHLLGLINDVLDMSKIESGKTTLNISEINMAELVDEIVTIVRPQAKAKGQELEVSVVDLHNEHILADKLRMNQILINLLSNAVKYTQNNGCIRLKITQLPQDKKNYAHYRFVVSDNGYGMSQDYVKVIFDPFTREENDSTNKIPGTGLGMAITKNLVELMNGTISVESELNKGSTFTVDLELRLQKIEIDQEFWFKHGITHALIVDDEVEVCTNIIGAMSGTGVSMQFAVDGHTAVVMAERAFRNGHGFDLILLDWKMPDMDGVETARRIRKVIPEHVPIMFLTAYDWSEIEEEALAAGITGFLPKPFFLTNFMQTIEKMKDSTDSDFDWEDSLSYFEGIHFLAAEDNELNAEILSDLLDMKGATVTVAENGQKVVELFEASKPGDFDAILMDVQMPLMNGYEATRAIRSSSHPLGKTIPIIAMTANAFAEDVRDALDSGMNSHVAKPIELGQLEKALKEVLKK